MFRMWRGAFVHNPVCIYYLSAVLLSSFVTTNFTAAEINEREVEVRTLLDTSPIVFTYGYGVDPHDPYSMLVERPESHFEDILNRCKSKDPQQSPVYLIGKLETSIEGKPRPFTFQMLFLPEFLTPEPQQVRELVRASLYDRALSYFVERSLMENPPPTYRARRIGS